ncbi:MAG: T9SS type A sorting domain-containing protein [Prevotellaceae bacterium]|jgi:hypothetical protein|nr:T9SS type A sorting domain-containing protein [Prevotellaceae bacterium]
MKQIFFLPTLLVVGYLSGTTAQAQNNLHIRSFTINDGSNRTSDRTITLNHTVENGKPTFYSASEDSTTLGREWLLYTETPTLQLSENMGLKDVYFIVANEQGISNTMHDYIYLDAAVTIVSYGLTATVRPNPVEADATITVDGEIQQINVTVYSVGGTICLTQTFRTPSFSLDLSRCPAGTLLIHLSSGQNYIVKRIIKL